VRHNGSFPPCYTKKCSPLIANFRLILVRPSVHVIEPPTSRMLHLTSWIVVWSCFWFALSFVGVFAVLLWGPWLAMILLGIFTTSQAAAIMLGFRFRCPACHDRILVHGRSPLHPARKIWTPVASWIAVAFDIARHREFICMHCGERCSVKV
jgi:DNA-directed RNA polymerase subunit RPC12/RpoP